MMTSSKSLASRKIAISFKASFKMSTKKLYHVIDWTLFLIVFQGAGSNRVESQPEHEASALQKKKAGSPGSIRLGGKDHSP